MKDSVGLSRLSRAGLGLDAVALAGVGLGLVVLPDRLLGWGLAADSGPGGRLLACLAGLQAGVLGTFGLLGLATDSSALGHGGLGLVAAACTVAAVGLVWHRTALTEAGLWASLGGCFGLALLNATALAAGLAWPDAEESPESNGNQRTPTEALEEPLCQVSAEEEPVKPDTPEVPTASAGSSGSSGSIGYGTLKLLKLAGPHRGWLFAGCIALLARLPFSISMAHWVRPAGANRNGSQVSAAIGCLSDGDYSGARWNVLALFIAGSVDSVLDFWCVYLFGVAQQRIIRGLRLELLRAIVTVTFLIGNEWLTRQVYQEVGFFDQTRTGEITSRLTADTAEMANDLTWVFRFTIEAVVRIGGVLGYMYVRCWQLALLACAVIPATSAVNRFYAVWLHRNQEQVQAALAEANAVAQDAVSAVLIVLSWLRTYKFLSVTALAGVVALVVAVAVTSVDCARHSHWREVDYSISSFPLIEVHTYPLFLGNAAYLYLISTAVLPLSQSMSQPSQFNKCLALSIMAVTVLNLCFGVYAWFSYGQCPSDGSYKCTQGNVIDNLAPGPLTTAVKLALCIDLIFTNVMFLLPVSEAIEAEVFPDTCCPARRLDQPREQDGDDQSKRLTEPSQRVAELSSDGSFKKECSRNVIRAALCVAVAFTAYGVPSFHLLTGLSGGFGNNLLGFILPPIFFVKLKHQTGYWDGASFESGAARRRLVQLILCVIMVLFGVVFMCLSTYSFISKLV